MRSGCAGLCDFPVCGKLSCIICSTWESAFEMGLEAWLVLKDGNILFGEEPGAGRAGEAWMQGERRGALQHISKEPQSQH